MVFVPYVWSVVHSLFCFRLMLTQICVFYLMIHLERKKISHVFLFSLSSSIHFFSVSLVILRNFCQARLLKAGFSMWCVWDIHKQRLEIILNSPFSSSQNTDSASDCAMMSSKAVLLIRHQSANPYCRFEFMTARSNYTMLIRKEFCGKFCEVRKFVVSQFSCVYI